MTEDSLHDRGKALEDLFFHDVDQKLLDRLKAETEADENRSCLMSATGIQDVDVINQLVGHGISVETLASVGLIPLIAVAWADGKMEKKEQDAILKAAAESGIDQQHSCYQLVSAWLKNKPADSLLDSWKDYIGALCQNLDATAVSQVKSSIIDRAQRVADSAGGFLGIHKTSTVEQRVIDELEATFG